GLKRAADRLDGAVTLHHHRPERILPRVAHLPASAFFCPAPFSASCFSSIAAPLAVSLLPRMAPMLFMAPYTYRAARLPVYPFLAAPFSRSSSRNFGITSLQRTARRACRRACAYADPRAVRPARRPGQEAAGQRRYPERSPASTAACREGWRRCRGSWVRPPAPATRREERA